MFAATKKIGIQALATGALALMLALAAPLIGQSGPVITFGAASGIPAVGGSFTVPVKASSGVPAGLRSTTPSVCSVAGGSVAVLRAGICAVIASGETQTFAVSVSRARGFSPSFAVSAGPTPTGAVVADLNRDGAADVVVANGAAGSLTILPGDGKGGFGPAVSIQTGGTVTAVGVADFNADGWLDLAAMDADAGTVLVLTGDGKFGFRAAGGPVLVTGRPGAVAVADFNGDGVLDLAVADSVGHSVTLLFGDGAGRMVTGSEGPVAVGALPASVVAADVNGDGKVDLITANSGTDSITVLLGNGRGQFVEATGSPLAVGRKPLGLALADFNGDGRLDVAVSNSGSNSVSVLLGDGMASFAPAPGSPFVAAVTPQGMTAGDFNGDGIPDLAVSGFGTNDATVLLGDGTGALNPAPGSPLAAGVGPVSVVAGDWDRDGRLDLLVVNSDSGLLSGLIAMADMSTPKAARLIANATGAPVLATSLSATPATCGNITTFTATLTHSPGVIATGRFSLTSQPADSVATSFGEGLQNSGNGSGLDIVSDSAVCFNCQQDVHFLFLGGAGSVCPGCAGNFPAYSTFFPAILVGRNVFETAQNIVAAINSDQSQCGYTVLADAPGTFPLGPLVNVCFSFGAGRYVSASFDGSGAVPAVNIAAKVTRASARWSATSGSNIENLSPASGSATGGYPPSDLEPLSTVTFTDSVDGTLCSNVAIATEATCDARLSGGTHTVQAAYSLLYGYTTNLTQLAYTLNPAPSLTVFSVDLSQGQPVFGRAVTLSAQVVGITGGANPTGTISFRSGGAPVAGCSPVALTEFGGGRARVGCVTTALPAGSPVLTAVYSGDGSYAGSTGGGGAVSIGYATSMASSPANPQYYGVPVTFTATAAGGAVSGTVAFTDSVSGVLCSAVPLNAGVASCTPSAPGFSVGTHTVTATYSLNGGNVASPASNTQTFTIGKAPATMTFTSTGNPSVSGQQVTFTAIPSAGYGVPATGTVSFTLGGAVSADCPPQTLAGGVATCATSALPAVVVASYAGDGNYSASTGTVTQQVSISATTLTASPASPQAYGAAMSFSAAVATAAVASGSFSFTAQPGDYVASNGNAGLPALHVGNAYWVFMGGTGSTCSGACSGQFSTYYGMASPPYGVILIGDTPAHTAANVAAAISNNQGLCGFRETSGAGNGFCFRTTTGQNQMTASATFAAVTLRSTVPGMLGNCTGATCSTAFGWSTQDSMLGEQNYENVSPVSGVLSAPLNAGTILSAPSGTVSFSDSISRPLACAPALAGGLATCTIPAPGLAPGSHTITATYNLPAGYIVGTVTMPFVVNAGAASVTLTSSSNPSSYGQAVMLTATVRGAGSLSPTGTVAFTAGGASVAGCASQVLSAAGAGTSTATCSSNSLPMGTTLISASYSGDVGNTGATSNGLSQLVGAVATVSASPVSPQLFGTPVRFTATTPAVVAGTQTTASGSFSFTGNPADFYVSSVSPTAPGSPGIFVAASNWYFVGDGSGSVCSGGCSGQYASKYGGSSPMILIGDTPAHTAANTAAAISNNPAVCGYTASGSGGASDGTCFFTPGVARQSLVTATSGGSTVYLSATTAGVGGNCADSPAGTCLSSWGWQTFDAFSGSPNYENVSPVSGGLSGGAGDIQAAGTVTFTDSVVGVLCSGVSLVSGTGNCQVGANGLAAGTHTITATFGLAGGYSAVATMPFTVSVRSQSISLGGTSGLPLVGQILTIPAASTSGLRVTLASTTPAVCTVAGVVVSLKAVGACTLQATQAGSAGYAAATPVSRSFSVAQPGVSGALTLAPASPVAAGTNPFGAATGDFNGDGKQDVAITSYGGNSVSILLGNGAGGFAAASGSPLAVGSLPVAVAAGDFNGDGTQDLAVTNSGDSTVTVLLGNGTGGFSAAAGSPFATGTEPSSIAVGDFNRDGVLDLAISNSGNGSVSVLLGNGAGGFSAAVSSPVAVGVTPYTVTTGDLNGDGILDLITANYASNSVSVLLGNGSGGFTEASGSPVAVGANPFGVSAVDLNGDGRVDLAISNAGSNNVTVLLGNGAGGFVAGPGSPFAAGANPLFLTAGDFNGDGYPDLAVPNYYTNNVTMLLGNGTGGFVAAGGSPIAVGTNPRVALAADFNGDGRLDLLTTNFGGNTATVMLGGIGVPSATMTTTAPASVSYGTAVPLTVNVTAAGSALIPPAGTVVILENGFTVGTAAQSVGPYSVSLGALPVGVHQLVAFYLGNAGNGQITSNVVTVTVTKAMPLVTWPAPAAITYGGALGAGQLNATANVPGTFVYTPTAGTVPAAGAGQTLSATFTPVDTSRYSTATATTTITVNPATGTPASLVVTRVMTRSGGNILVQLTLANNGGTAAANVVVTAMSLGGMTATPLPKAVGTIAAGASAQVTLTVPGTAGASGAASALSVTGSYSGGTFSSSSRVTLP